MKMTIIPQPETYTSMQLKVADEFLVRAMGAVQNGSNGLFTDIQAYEYLLGLIKEKLHESNK